MKKKIIISVAAVCVTIAVLLTFRMSIAYLIDAEVKDNIITIGNVHLEVSEESYVDSSVVAAGGSVVKPPVVINTGTEDEYVFLKIAVPKQNVTLLYETDTVVDGTTYKKGVPTVSNYEGENSQIKKNVDEIFKFIAETSQASRLTVTDAPKDVPWLDFSYNAGHINAGEQDSTPSAAGWVYLKRDTKNDYNYYYFGYNTRLKYDSDQTEYQKTIPLFDRVQLKSFIDEELVSKDENDKKDYASRIDVTAYGIQADSLGVSDVDSLERNAYLTKTQLEEIFGIVERKS